MQNRRRQEQRTIDKTQEKKIKSCFPFLFIFFLFGFRHIPWRVRQTLLRLHFQHGFFERIIAHPSARERRRVDGENGAYLPPPGCRGGGKRFFRHWKAPEEKAEGRILSSWMCPKILSNEDIKMVFCDKKRKIRLIPICKGHRYRNFQPP